MGSQPVAVIDENLARQYWPNENPGRHIRNEQKNPWKTIVGVVAPVRHSQVAGDEASADPWWLARQRRLLLPHVSGKNADGIFDRRQRAIHRGWRRRSVMRCTAVDPSQPVSDLKTMDQRVTLSLGPRRSGWRCSQYSR